MSLDLVKTFFQNYGKFGNKFIKNGIIYMNLPFIYFKDFNILFKTIRSCRQRYGKTILHKKCPYLELFWSAFSGIWTECGEMGSTCPYPVRMRGNTDQNNSKCGHFPRRACICLSK